jgi:hypothetical protein
VGNKKKPPGDSSADRKARVEALKREQKAAERKKTLGFVAVAVIVGGVLIAIPTISIINKNHKKDVAFDTIGAPSGLAACDAVITDAVGKNDGDHESDPSVTISYQNAPPSHGRHFASPATVNSRGFYTSADSPRVEELVHNLEHGYTIAWYLPSVTGSELADLKLIAEKMRDSSDTAKFIAAPWDPARGAFPAGKSIAYTHWGAPKTLGDYSTASSYRQYCRTVSGGATKSFVDAHPSSDSPEPNTP